MSVPSTNWWNNAWTKRVKLNVSANDAVLSGYAVHTVITGTLASSIYSDSQTTGNDARVLFWTGFKWKELNRYVEEFTSSTLDIWFKLQGDVASNGSDDNYYLYYANSNPFGPHSGPKAVHTTYTGLDEYIGVSYNSSQSPTSEITFEGWAYRHNWTDYTTSSRILSKTQTGGYQIGINEGTMGGDGWVGVLVRRNGSYAVAKAPRSTLTNGWHHFAGTYDGRNTKFYIDGELKATDDAGGDFPIQYSVSNALIIGAEAGSGATPAAGTYFEGYIEGVKIWNTALSQASIQANMVKELLGSETNLVGYWKLNEGGGTNAADATSTQDGTLTNGVGWVTTNRVTENADEVFTFVDKYEDNTFMKYDTHDAGWSIQTTTVKRGSYAAQSTSTSAQSLVKDAINQVTSVYEGWFRFGQTNQFHYPFFNNNNLGTNNYWIVASNTGNWQYNLGSYTNFPNSNSYSANTWYFVKLVYNAETSKFRVWFGTDQNSLTELTTISGLDAQDNLGDTINTVTDLRHLNTDGGGSGTMWADSIRVRPGTTNEPTVAAFNEIEQDVTAKANLVNTISKLLQSKAYINPPDVLNDVLANTIRKVTGKVEIKWDGISWTDESEYLISARGNIQISGPIGEASSGEMDIELDNTSDRFDPENTNSSLFGLMRPKIEVRVLVDFEDIGYFVPVFYGMIRSISPDSRTAITNIHCFDISKKIIDKKAQGTVLVNKRLDEVFDILASEAGLSTTEYNSDITEHSIHGAWFGNKNIWELMGKLAVAERGRVFFDEKGILRFWGRKRLRDKKAGTLTLTRLDWLKDLDYEISDAAIKNHIIVTAKPRASAGIQQVWSNGDIEALDPFTDTLIFIPAKQSQFAFIELEDPATNWFRPIAYSDFTANTLINGTGDDLTLSIKINAFITYDDAVFLAVSNESDKDAYLTKFNIRANPLRIYKWIKIEAQDENSIDLYGEKNLEIENNFIDDEINAQDIATEELARWKNAKNNFSASILGIPYFRCGDVVNVEVRPNTNIEYMISSVDWNLDDDGFTQKFEFVNPIRFPVTKSVSARGSILSPIKKTNAKAFINIIA